MVKPSSYIQSFDPLLEVQSDKASVEITSPFDGIVKELLVQEGHIAKVGNTLCTIEVDEEAVQDLEDKGILESVDKTGGSGEAQPGESRDDVAVDSYGVKQAQISSSSQAVNSRPHPLDPNRPQSPQSDIDVLATPSTRHYARSQNIDLTLLAPGSGKGGRIERSDVDAFIALMDRGSTEEAWPEVFPSGDGEDVVVELNRTRNGMWKAMTKVRFVALDSRILLKSIIFLC